MDKDPEPSLIEKLENLEGRATRGFFAGDYGSPVGDRLPGPGCRAGDTIPSSAVLAAYELLNAATRTAERKLAALVDAVACVLAHNGRYGSQETARLAFETVVEPAVALAAVRALLEDERAV